MHGMNHDKRKRDKIRWYNMKAWYNQTKQKQKNSQKSYVQISLDIEF